MELDMIGTTEIAKELGVTTGYIRHLVKVGKAKPKGKVGANWVFDREELEKLRGRRRTKGPEPKQK